jgi:hypothetical protein
MLRSDPGRGSGIESHGIDDKQGITRELEERGRDGPVRDLIHKQRKATVACGASPLSTLLCLDRMIVDQFVTGKTSNSFMEP